MECDRLKRYTFFPPSLGFGYVFSQRTHCAGTSKFKDCCAWLALEGRQGMDHLGTLCTLPESMQCALLKCPAFLY